MRVRSRNLSSVCPRRKSKFWRALQNWNLTLTSRQMVRNTTSHASSYEVSWRCSSLALFFSWACVDLGPVKASQDCVLVSCINWSCYTLCIACCTAYCTGFKHLGVTPSAIQHQRQEINDSRCNALTVVVLFWEPDFGIVMLLWLFIILPKWVNCFHSTNHGMKQDKKLSLYIYICNACYFCRSHFMAVVSACILASTILCRVDAS